MEPIENKTFAEIMPYLLAGWKVSRAAWVDSILWVSRFTNYAWNGVIYERAPQFQQMDVNNALTPWLPNQQDMEAADWKVVESIGE